jgi:N-acetylmuramoyl-L-alanine amidase
MSNKLKILGAVPRGVTVEAFKKFFDSRGIPTVFQILIPYYRKHGEKYGVRWDFAIFQSILETGNYRFEGSSVKSIYYNYAGIGATDQNPAPEKYDNPSAGIEAQIQILAIRAGVAIERENMISDRYKRYYDLVFNKCKYWEDLAGTWATDPLYYSKILSIAKSFERIVGVEVTKNVLETNATWFTLHLHDNKSYCSALDGSQVVESLAIKTKSDLEWFFRRHKQANNVHVTTASITPENIIDSETVEDVETPPNHTEYNPEESPLFGKSILIDPGHSERHPGARGLAPDYPEEEDLNRLQASIIAGILTKAGASVEVYDPDADPLYTIGRRAAGKDLFLSLHHNAYNRDRIDEYTCVCVHRSKANEKSKRLASNIAKSISKRLGLTLYKPNAYYPGVYPLGLSVLSGAHDAGCHVCVLVESYFVDAYGNSSLCQTRSASAARAIAKAVIDYLK